MIRRFTRWGMLLGLILPQATWLFAQETSGRPQVLKQPAAAVRVREGGQLRLSVGADGAPPLTYQWYRDAQLLSAFTAADLALLNVTAQDGGAYTVVVSNSLGAVTSAVSSVSIVLPETVPPSISAQPKGTNNVIQGASYALSVEAVGTLPFSYQWYQDGTAWESGTNASLALENLVYANSGAYTVVVGNSAGSVTSLVARVIVLPLSPIILEQPTNTVIVDGSDLSMTASAVGAPTLSFQWYYENTLLQSSAAAEYAGAVSNSTVSLLTISSSSSPQAGAYRVVVSSKYGAQTSQVAQVTIGQSAPFILDADQPMADSQILVSNSFSLSAVVLGTKPLACQWRRGDILIPDATNALLIVTNAQFADTGDYTLLVTNSLGAVTSTVAHVSVNPWSPTITTQPEPLTNVLQGALVYLSVDATGKAPLSYQWYLNGEVITNATDYYLPVATHPFFSTNGIYTVTVSNSYGVVTSAGSRIDMTPLRSLDLLVDPTSTNANEILLPVYVSSQMDEQEIQFSVQADPSVLSLLSAQLDLEIQNTNFVAFLNTNSPPVFGGVDSPQILFSVDSSQVSEGRIGVSVALPTNAHLTSGRIRLATIKANILPGASLGSSALDWVDSPLPIRIVSTTEAHGTNYGLSSPRVAVGSQLGIGPAVVASPISPVANPQTGYFDQLLSVVNAGKNDLAGYLIWFKDLGVDSHTNQITLANAADTSARSTNSWWWMQMGALAAGATASATAEYYIPDRATLPQPIILGAALASDDLFATSEPTLSTNYQVHLDRTLFVNGVFVVEFPSSKNISYYVQYAEDLNSTNWTTSFPSVKGTGTRAQWVDNGPPRTASKPTSQASRFYRILVR